MVILGIQENSLGQLGHGPSAAGLRSSGPCTNNAATDGGAAETWDVRKSLIPPLKKNASTQKM